MKKKMLIYGAGAIGRGFMPWVFPPSEFLYYFVEINPHIRQLLNHRKKFQTLKTVGGAYETRGVVAEYCYAPDEDCTITPAVDVVVLAVGPRNVLSLSENLKNITVPIICAENDASVPKLVTSMTRNKNAVFAIPDVITSNTAPPEILTHDPLTTVSEDGVCYIDERVSYLGGNATYVSSETLEKEWKAKLYLHNTPHCIAAYLGSFVGALYIHEAMQFPKVRAVVAGSMNEMRAMLLKHFQLDEHFVNWYAKKDLKLFVDMTSNGICLNNEMADQIISSKLDILNISLDGTCFEEYNSIRGGTEDQFKTLVANVKNLCSKVKSLNSSLEINVTFITTIVNYKQLPKMIDFVISLGVEGVQFQNVLDFETKFMSEHRPIYKSNKEAVSFINSIKKPDKIKRIIWPLVLDLDIIKSEHHINCHYPFTTIGVNTNGDVNLCCLVNTQESYGNIFKDYDVWNNKPFQDIRQTLSKGKMPFKLCKTCPLSME